MAKPDVIVVGGGVIGLAIAWRVAQRGRSVTVVDPHPGDGASHTAAGMLAPVTELHYEGRDLLALNLESARRYPGFVAELRDATGLDVGYRECGTVQAAWDAADLADLRALQAFQESLGVRSEMLTSRELRRGRTGRWRPDCPADCSRSEDHQVDNRALVDALMSAGRREPGSSVVTRSASPDRRATPASRSTTATRSPRRSIVLAAGRVVARHRRPDRRAAGTAGEGPDAAASARPDLLHQVVRGSVRGNPVYIVPRVNGELVIGASSEEAGFDLRARAGAVYELLRDAQTLIPELSEAEFVEVSTSVRPGSPDNAPLLGRSEVDSLVSPPATTATASC